MIDIHIKKLTTNAIIPSQKYKWDAGFDLYAVDRVIINPFERKLVRTGIAMSIPEGYYGRIAPRSGLALKNGIDVMAGVIDCFSEDSTIKTLNGEKTIKDLKIGETLFSVNEKTFEIEEDKISAIVDTNEQEVFIFNTDAGVLEVTANTLIYTSNGIKKAKDVDKNDLLIIF